MVKKNKQKGEPFNDLHKTLELLQETYPEAKCELVFHNPFELLIATMLSAQSTDERVNKVTQRLFKRYPTPQSFIALGQKSLELEIKEIGLYRNKAKNIIATCEKILKDYDGKIPSNQEELRFLPGVGRKTANVVVANAFGVPAMAVDTHVFRVAHRLGLSIGKNPEQVEMDLMKIIPKEKWIDTHHQLIWHGRKICKARSPHCLQCPISNTCEYFLNTN